jgi:hypothetical protein
MTTQENSRAEHHAVVLAAAGPPVESRDDRVDDPIATRQPRRTHAEAIIERVRPIPGARCRPSPQTRVTKACRISQELIIVSHVPGVELHGHRCRMTRAASCRILQDHPHRRRRDSSGGGERRSQRYDALLGSEGWRSDGLNPIGYAAAIETLCYGLLPRGQSRREIDGFTP